MKNIFTILSIWSIIFLMSAGVVLAQAGSGSSGGNSGGGVGPSEGSVSGVIEIGNPFKGGDTIPELLKTIINDITFPIGGVIAVLAFIYSGFLYVSAQGNAAQISKAHNALLYSAIGTALLLGAWVVSEVITGTINQLKS